MSCCGQAGNSLCCIVYKNGKRSQYQRTLCWISLFWFGQDARHNAAHTCILKGQIAKSHSRRANAEVGRTASQWNSERYKWAHWPDSLSVNAEHMADWKTTRAIVHLRKVKAVRGTHESPQHLRLLESCRKRENLMIVESQGPKTQAQWAPVFQIELIQQYTISVLEVRRPNQKRYNKWVDLGSSLGQLFLYSISIGFQLIGMCF